MSLRLVQAREAAWAPLEEELAAAQAAAEARADMLADAQEIAAEAQAFAEAQQAAAQDLRAELQARLLPPYCLDSQCRVALVCRNGEDRARRAGACRPLGPEPWLRRKLGQ